MRLTSQEKQEFERIICKYTDDPTVQLMKNFTQHGSISTYEHCMTVARTAFAVNRKLKIGANEESLVKVGLLHDFYLYDWHEKSKEHCLHGFSHAQKAAENAKNIFHVSKQEYQAIESHMWPLNITRLPKSRLGWLICLTDKYCAFKETVFSR